MASAVRRADDQLTVHTFSSWLGEPIASTFDSYTVLRELPEPKPSRVGSTRWAISRAMTYVQSARLRSAEVSRGKYHVCHIFNLNYFTDPWTLGSLARASSLVSTVHDVVPHQGRLLQPIEMRLLQRMYDKAGRLIVAHPELSARLQAEFRVPSSRISVVPLPVKQVGPSESSKRPDGRPHVVLFFGTLRSNKGVGVLIEAIRLLKAHDDIIFQFAGTGTSDVPAMVLDAANRDPRITTDIRWIPAAAKDSYYRRADLVVLPYTDFASQSGVLGDAYSYGVPVVASDVGALGPTVKADRTGWVVPPGDAEALADAIRNALSNKHERDVAAAACVTAGRARTPEKIGAALRRIYEELAT